MLEEDAAATDAVLAGQKGAAAGDRDPGRGAPRHTGRRPFLGTHSSKQSPEPLVPAAAKAGMSPSGRAHGYQGHYKFLALHRAQPRPRADNKRFSSLSHRLCETPSPTTEPRPGAGRKQRSSTQRPPAQNPFLSLCTRTGRFRESHPLRRFSAPCWPESEDEPRVLHTHSPARQHRAVAVPGGAGRVRGADGEARNAEPGGLPGTGRRGAAGWAHDCSPRTGQRSGDRHQTK